jgi:hypothetical protein
LDSGALTQSVSAATIPGVPTLVETVLLSVRSGRLCFRTVSGLLGTGEDPDACARSLAGRGVRLLHSTSWRYTGSGLVLTYVALPDPDPAPPARPVPDRPPPPGADPLTPTPPAVGPADVAAHACRHLAFLRHTDAHVSSAEGPGELWDLIDAFTPAVAGRLSAR